MSKKTLIMDDMAIARAIRRITHEIIEHNAGVDNLCLLGIKTRGVVIAQKLAQYLKQFENVEVPVGILDITLHRDDLSQEEKTQKASDCHIPCDITDKKVIICDDVLYTGRTVRAAIESVFAHGRPKCLELAVLVDRGHRELPIRPDYVGKNVPTSQHEEIQVLVQNIDSEDAVYIYER